MDELGRPAPEDFDQVLKALEGVLRFTRAGTFDEEAGEMAAYRYAERLLRRYRPATRRISSTTRGASR
jgi:DNA-binding transcriptional regulator PaaX